MEKDKFDILIGEGLKEEMRGTKMSDSFKESIKNNTIKRKKSVYEKFKDIMDTTIEIPLPSAVAVCILISFLTFSTFSVTENMKRDKSIQGYTSFKIVKMGGFDVYIDNESEGLNVEKNKD